MSGLSIQCQHLSGGTARQKRRAWTELVLENGLWGGCRQAVEAGGSLGDILDAYEALSRDWDRGPIVEATGAAPEVVEEQVAAARRLLAAGAVALLIRRPDVDA